MTFHNCPADSQTYAGPGIFFSVLQSLKHQKYLLKIIRFYVDTIIMEGKKPFASFLISRNMDAGCSIPAKLDSVADEVLE
jgi:hypothetical protein